MFEIAWKEISKTERIVVKRKAFSTEAAMNRFVEKLFDKDNFLGIIAVR